MRSHRAKRVASKCKGPVVGRAQTTMPAERPRVAWAEGHGGGPAGGSLCILFAVWSGARSGTVALRAGQRPLYACQGDFALGPP